MKKRTTLRFICLILAVCFAANVPCFAAKGNNSANFTEFTCDGGITRLGYQSGAQMLADMQLVCSKGNFEFWFDPSSLFFAVKDIKSGKIFTSNPYNAADTTSYTGNTAKALNSQLIINYSTVTDKKTSTLWSYDDCVALSQFKVYKSNDCVKVVYSIGKEAGSSALPAVLSHDTFGKILNSLSGLAATQTKFLYTEYKEGKELPKGFEDISYDGSVYIINQNLTESEKERLEGYITQSGFTLKDLEREYKALGYTANISNAPNFKINVYYKLTESGLSVTIPAEEIEFDRDTYYLLDISLLKYFGCENYSGGNGFLLLPDGSGAVTEFSENKNTISQIKNELYGTDYGITLPDTPSSTKVWYLPIFGISNGNNAVLGIIEDGSGLSSLCFDMAGGIGSFYTAYPILSLTKSEVITTEAKVYSAYSTSNTQKIDENYYTGEYKINYYLLTNDNITYYDMALVCRKHYFGENTDAKQCSPTLDIETLGAIEYPSTFMGISYTATAAVTTFAQNIDILKQLQSANVYNVNLYLIGWRKNGLNSGVATAFDPERVLGGKKGIKELYKYCLKNNIKIGADVSFSFTSKDRLFDGFSANGDTIRLLTSKLGGKMAVRPDLGVYDRDSFTYAITPAKYSKYLKKFISKADKNDVSSFLISDSGNTLNSDFKKKYSFNREQTLDTVTAVLESNSKNSEFSFRGANSYILKYASRITDLPTEDSSLTGISYDVPFVQLVCHGNISYSCTELNSESDIRYALLKCISALSSPKFVLGSQNMNKIKLSQYTNYNSISVNTRMNDCIDAFEYIKGAFKKVVGQTLIGHTTLADGITRLNYTDGICIYVNATSSDYAVDNITIPAMDYAVSE